MGLSIIKKLYDKISANYNPADQFGSISKTHEIALNQFLSEDISNKESLNIVDLGVGDAGFLKKISDKCNNINCIGVDISSGMLRAAQKKIKMRAIHDSAANVHKHLGAKTQDFII